ncbi:hypothetical protein BDZ97DRAFT_1755027 [Flammula alnicola]|nr:hypothetical protein BDZ97DRAFT_1755027 [Flammula alnicola]
MPPPPPKKAKSTAASVNDHPLGPITDRDSLVESDSEGDLELVTVHAEEEDGDTDSSDSNSDENIVPSAPPSPPPTVTKRKRGRKAKIVEEDEISEEAPSKKLTYLLSILSAEEASKPVSKRMPISESLELGDKEPWDTVKAQLLVKIDTALSPRVLAFSDYMVMFYISRVLPKPGMALSTEDNYAALLLRAGNLTSKTPTINLTIQQKKSEANKENEATPSAAEAKDGGKAAKKKKEPAVLPGNVNRALNVQKLQERWKCVVRQPGTCIGAYCYVVPDTGIHLPLNHERLECWSSAMLKNDDSSTVEKPPNHRLFDPETPSRSPVLQRRLDAQNAKGSATSSVPVFNISVGDGILDLFRPARAAVPDAPAPQMLAGPAHVNKMLLNPACDVGPDMPIAQFCDSFGLQRSVLEKLEENAYDFARNLRFITLDNLTEMSFKLGEKAALQDAVERWSVPRVA